MLACEHCTPSAWRILSTNGIQNILKRSFATEAPWRSLLMCWPFPSLSPCRWLVRLAYIGPHTRLMLCCWPLIAAVTAGGKPRVHASGIIQLSCYNVRSSLLRYDDSLTKQAGCLHNQPLRLSKRAPLLLSGIPEMSHTGRLVGLSLTSQYDQNVNKPVGPNATRCCISFMGPACLPPVAKRGSVANKCAYLPAQC
jgi:hypothetical protein